LAFCAFLVASALLGVVEEILITRTRDLTSTDRYDFIVGPIIPALIATAVWCFFKEKPGSPAAP
jgi:hypothetical protein